MAHFLKKAKHQHSTTLFHLIGSQDSDVVRVPCRELHLLLLGLVPLVKRRYKRRPIAEASCYGQS